MKNSEKTLDMIVNLCKSRGFVYAGSEIYGNCQKPGTGSSAKNSLGNFISIFFNYILGNKRAKAMPQKKNIFSGENFFCI